MDACTGCGSLEPEIWICRDESHQGLEVTGGTTDRAAGRHFHEECELGFVERGAGRLWVGGREHLLRRGEAWLVAAGEVHRTVPSAGGWTFRTVHAPSGAVAAGLGRGARLLRGGGLPEPRVARRVWRAMELLDECRPSLEGDAALEEAFASAGALAAGRAPAHPGAGLHGRRIGEARDFLADHFAEAVRLPELAGRVGLSPYQLLRAFERRYGAPPHAFQRLLRVERAKALLRAGLPLAEVALATGFADQSHLGRAFKAVTGLTPGQYQAWTAPGRRAVAA